MRLIWFEIEYYKMKWPVSVYHWTWFQWCYSEPLCHTTIAASLQHSIPRSHHSFRLGGLDGFRLELGSSVKCLCGLHCSGIRVKFSVSVWHRWGRTQDDHTRLQWKSSWKATRHCSCTWIIASIENEYKYLKWKCRNVKIINESKKHEWGLKGLGLLIKTGRSNHFPQVEVFKFTPLLLIWC